MYNFYIFSCKEIQSKVFIPSLLLNTMGFEEKKKETLLLMHEEDKSKKGSLDSRIISILNLINKCSDYYTTSSCSGRISLIERSLQDKKYLARWLFVSHEQVIADQLIEAFRKEASSNLWFRQEGPILHIACKDIRAAARLLRFIREAGYKRAGAFNLESYPIVEVMSSEQFEVPIVQNGDLIVDEDYFYHLVELGNSKMRKAWKRMAILEAQLQDLCPYT